MADTISPEVSDRICKHMNVDHGEAVLMYAQVFGKVQQATSAEMVTIDNKGMEITALTGSEEIPVRVEFDHTLEDSEDAHQTLIAMVKEARKSVKS